MTRQSFGTQYRTENRISLNIHNVQMRKQNSYLRIFKIYEFRIILAASMIFNTSTLMLADDYSRKIKSQKD
jgi:hypothetical protein